MIRQRICWVCILAFSFSVPLKNNSACAESVALLNRDKAVPTQTATRRRTQELLNNVGHWPGSLLYPGQPQFERAARLRYAARLDDLRDRGAGLGCISAGCFGAPGALLFGHLLRPRTADPFEREAYNEGLATGCTMGILAAFFLALTITIGSLD